MTHVETIDPWSAGDGGSPVEAVPGSAPGTDPTDRLAPGEPPEAAPAESLIGFLLDFRAAGREPEPETPPTPPRPGAGTAVHNQLSRFTFAPPDPLDIEDDLEPQPAPPLPVWAPPQPAAEAPTKRGVNLFRRRR